MAAQETIFGKFNDDKSALLKNMVGGALAAAQSSDLTATTTIATKKKLAGPVRA